MQTLSLGDPDWFTTFPRRVALVGLTCAKLS
jgi:hypothetical protein